MRTVKDKEIERLDKVVQRQFAALTAILDLCKRANDDGENPWSALSHISRQARQGLGDGNKEQ